MTRAPRLLWLFAFALFARAVIPAGWMPSNMPGEVVMLCTEAGLQQAWVDADGRLHKSDAPGQHEQSPCAFAGLAMAQTVPQSIAASDIPLFDATDLPQRLPTLAVGQGLAAPPPPKTGPPLNT